MSELRFVDRFNLKKRQQLKKERELKAKRDELAGVTGLYFSSSIYTEAKDYSYVKYIVNALAIFSGCFGALMCLATAFHFEFSLVIFTIFSVFLAVLLSFMYVNQRVKIIGYLILLAFSFVFVVLLFVFINSGMNAIRNICLTAIDEVFPLPRVREYSEWYGNRYVSVTVTMCTISLMISILLNIFISEYMNVAGVLAVTLPFVAFAMYFNMPSGKIPMLLVLTCWLLVFGIKLTNSYHGLTRKRSSTSSVKKHRHYYGFVTDSYHVATIAAVLSSYIFLTSLVMMLLIPQGSFAISTPLDSMKNSTNTSVKNILSYGFANFFHINSSDASPGKISNSGSVAYDGQVDFVVKMVDYTDNRIYLKQEAMEVYSPKLFLWSSSLDVRSDKKALDEDCMMENFTSDLMMADYRTGKQIAKTKHQMEIKVVDPEVLADYQYLPVPYYTTLPQEVIEKGKALSEDEISEIKESKLNDVASLATIAYTFYPQGAEISEETIEAIHSDLKDDAYEEAYEDLEEAYYENYVKKYCLEVDEVNRPVIERICRDYGLSPNSETVVEDVVDYLSENYDYTMRPGRVPATEDFVNYFLAGSKKGYCVHFASSATLMLRYLGVPARYVEGYVIDPEDLGNSTSIEGEDASKWIEGVDTSNADLVEINITDANGHAWVEIYDRNLGWVPVEATLATSIDDEEGGFLFDFLGLAESNSTLSNAQNLMNQFDEENAKKTRNYMILAIIVFVLGYGIYQIIRILGKRKRRKDRLKVEDYNLRVSRRYEDMRMVMNLIYGPHNECKSHETIVHELYEHGWMNVDFMEEAEFLKALEHSLFSKDGSDKENNEEILENINLCIKKMCKQMTVKQKFRYYFVDVYW